ncbi:MAG: hypothetical protein GY950_25070, partial [bacterium]|nr:hypothetical protein [bacterium]
MFIDRIFSVSGFGTVVTGSVMSGTLSVKDTLYLLPGKAKELNVRRLERHGKEVTRVKAGDRASINLVGLDKADFKKGMIIADVHLKETAMVDAHLELFEKSPGLGVWSHVIFHVGTYENQARVHLIDKNKIAAGEKGLVQIQLDQPCVLRFGDRFVIRNSSSDMTLGGGEVIDAAPLYHRKRPVKLIEKMTAIAEGKLPEVIFAEVRKFHQAVSAQEIAFGLNISGHEVETCIKKKLPGDIVTYEAKGGTILITKERQEKLQQGILTAVRESGKQNLLV